MRRILEQILAAPTWEDFKEQIYALHRQMFASTKNKFLMQIMASILDDRRAVLFDGRDTDKPRAGARAAADAQGPEGHRRCDRRAQRQAGGSAGFGSPHAHAGDDKHLAMKKLPPTAIVLCQAARLAFD